MLEGNFAQLFEITNWRNQYSCRSGHRLDNNCSDGFCTMKRNNRLEIIREMRAPLRTTLGKCVMLRMMGMRQMVHTSQERAKLPSVIHDTADRDASKANAIISTFATDESCPCPLSNRTLVSERNF